MSSEIVAKRYASALMDLTQKDSKLQAQIEEQLVAVVGLFDNKEIRKILASPVINPELLTAVFANVTQQLSTPEVLTQFLRVLIETRRIALLPAIKQAFHRLFLEGQNSVEATVVSAVKLDSAELEQIQAKIEAMLNKKVLIDTAIDKTILGGFVIKIDNNLIDMSLRTKLDNLTKFAVS